MKPWEITVHLFKKLIYPVYLIIFVLFTVAYAVVWLLSYLSKDRVLFIQNFFRSWFDIGLRLNAANIEVIGIDKIPAKGASIILCDRDLMKTGYVFQAIKRKVIFVAEPEYFDFPFSLITNPSGWLRIDKKHVAGLRRDVDKIIDAINKGEIIFVVSEYQSYLEGDFNSMVFAGPEYLSLKSGAPVVPFKVEFSEGFRFTLAFFAKNKMSHIKITFGDPIYPDNNMTDRISRVRYFQKISEQIRRL